jgi:predicted 3-demethylubiquinone-9 3-methyltransferase (glyoxalase superfamily)
MQVAPPKITPFLWFDANAEEAANLYVSVFPDSKILETTRYGASGPGPAGSVMTMKIVLRGQELVLLNGGPHFKFTEAVSFVVDCADQEEVDHYWEKLRAPGVEGQCGWIKDRFGLSWQIVPTALPRLLQDKDPARSQRVMKAMMKMKKLDVAALEAAAKG